MKKLIGFVKNVGPFVLLLCFMSSLQASEPPQNLWGVAGGYAFAGMEFPGSEKNYNFGLEAYIRHYYKENWGIELSGMYIPKKTTVSSASLTDVEPPIVIRFEAKGYAVPVRMNFVYSPMRKNNRASGISLLFGAGLLFDHVTTKRLDEPPAEFVLLFPEHDQTQGLFEIDYGITGEFNLNESLVLMPRCIFAYGSEELVGFKVASLGIGYRF